VGMGGKCLTPSVESSQESRLGTEELWIG
jgi:hypothetical protein